MSLLRLLLIFLSISCLCACSEKRTLFKKITSSHSGISFNNAILENDTINPFDVVNIYNGGGVGIGDFNKDGLQDVYFTGNMVPSKLYLNKGDFHFVDITEKAGVEGLGRWGRGVSIVDINDDGLSDIYICNTIYKDSMRRRNILYINQGADKEGIPHFTDMAAAYGLDAHMQSTMANFFDYDNDGDLDVYITVNEATSESNPSAFGKNRSRKSDVNRGKLYRNDWDSSLHHGVYHNVSDQAGITLNGYGHGATIADINQDGWKDIYVSDDFLSSNILYINNHDGTFTDRSREYFKHTAYNAMGQDIADVNNDGLPDVIELDMSPPDNYRRKMMLGNNNYNTIQNFLNYGYQLQYVRNVLQLNQGPRVLENDSVGAPIFSDIGFMSGIAQTDWSWTPLLMDFDNDSYRDLIVTNGFPKDVSDHDFIAYRQQAPGIASKEFLLSKIPEIKLHNYAFRNTNGLLFNDVSAAWGLEEVSFSNGAAYADLDNDGDLDVVINNINDEAFVYQNTLREKNDTSSNYLQVKLDGPAGNREGIGAVVSIHYGGSQQVYENMPYRGYLSTHQALAHFGLGKIANVDSLVVTWDSGKVQVLQNIKANQVLTLSYTNATNRQIENPQLLSSNALFKEITRSLGLSFKHKDIDFIDFNIQTTLPHKLSEYCPAVAAGDVDGNGMDDLVVGGNAIVPATLFLQQTNGKFLQRPLKKKPYAPDYKDGGLLLFDVNGDGSLDLYATSAGYGYTPNSASYNDRLYLNDGKGNFTLDSSALPQNRSSKMCVRAFDYNKDGKLDLFVSGRVQPWQYPKPVSSFIYRNDSQNGKVAFTDVTAQVAPDLANIGMVCDAIFSDFDNDGQTDLILAGEWMPITFLKNDNGNFKNVTKESGIANQLGWWNSITAGDFRHTGRTDYIIGNLGLNSFYKATDAYPVYITAKDFDNNGGYEAIPTVFLPDEHGTLREFPAHGRDDVLDKMPFLKKKFLTYHSFALATFDQVFTAEQLKGAQRLKANNLKSCFLRNDGGGKFTIIPLPDAAQLAPLSGMVTGDFDDDGNLDVLLNGNDYGTEVSVGRYDALNGLLLKGDGKGAFTPLSILQSGIYIPGNGKGLVRLLSEQGQSLVAAAQNQDALKIFALKRSEKNIRVLPDDLFAIITYADKTTAKQEFYYGDSFLSQSARFMTISDKMERIQITNAKGQIRTVPL